MADRLKLSSNLQRITAIILLIGGVIFYIGILRPQQNYYATHSASIQGIYLLKPIKINDFELTDHHDKKITIQNLKQRWTLLFFGFTHCDSVCPTTLAALNKTLTILQSTVPQNDLPHVLFITVDPERDTTARLSQYVTAFNPSFIGARTSRANTDSIRSQFHIEAEKSQQSVTNYAVNHSAEIVLINPDAQIQAYFSYPHEPEQMARDYQLIVNLKKHQ
jgi:protein SCO1/2